MVISLLIIGIIVFTVIHFIRKLYKKIYTHEYDISMRCNIPPPPKQKTSLKISHYLNRRKDKLHFEELYRLTHADQINKRKNRNKKHGEVKNAKQD